MTEPAAAPPVDGGVALLERALGYTLGSLTHVSTADLTRPTPCSAWNLRGLLRHMDASLVALGESAQGHLDMPVVASRPADAGRLGVELIEPAAAVRNRACSLLGSWTSVDRAATVTIGDATMRGDVLAGAGALEVAVHGWDVARSLRYDHPIPDAFARDLLMLASLFVTPADRPGRFAAPVAVPVDASHGDQLVAFLGRVP